MKLMKVNWCDTANGSGIGVSVWVSGCSMHCKGCHNPEAWDKEAGFDYTPDVWECILEEGACDHITHLSILGGDPLEPYNKDTVRGLVAAWVGKFPDKPVYLWTGRTLSKAKKIMEDWEVKPTVLIVGPYQEKKKCTNPMYGSSNQAIYCLTFDPETQEYDYFKVDKDPYGCRKPNFFTGE